MKTITIGRGDGCNIYIDDESMSRRHAIIKIPTFGGMEIVDMSKNGTSVNGVRLRPNVPFPVSRKDVVTFADVAQLDWAKVPDPLKYYKLGALIVGGLIVLLLAIWLVKSLFSGSKEELVKPAIEQVEQPASMVEKQKESTIEESAQELAEDETEAQSPASTEEKETVDPVRELNKIGYANKLKREAAERARQQKAKEQKAKEQQKQKEQKQKEQQQKEQQKQEDSKQPSEGNSSKKEYKPEMI